MDYGGVMKCKKVKKQRRRSDDHNSKKSNIKVVYISTPMKVKTSASRFRALVQELTGPDSDIARIMESNGATEFEDHNGHGNNELRELLKSSSPSPSPSSSLLQAKSNSSSVSSESNYFTEPNFEDLLFSSQMEEQFLALLASANSEIDVLGSYDAL
ncbi:sigma factor binding protein 1, chloroplastic-like [Nicotiana tomentosiformis]|uniref:Sigma factor binding protein 1, chloroplastic-like n=1 Tax=Nicotiana tabacum TaxID=4097 RepID=A0A1S4CTR3_TOBAC|nr:sigma factor binding protein 1, chloroplastic-like [Nicotiana tomentosiformis]XP_016504503.1 PREDICTED: sigma factor binding protein 1, chloroplastic-like [Nicotiana tabacum]